MTVARPPTVVAVIPTKDRWMMLPTLLTALDAQTRPPARVIIVDASRDPPPAELTGRPPSGRLTVLRHQPPSAAAQRNLGIRAALGHADLIALLDDDVMLAPDALERMADFWSSPRAAGVAGAGFNQTDLGSRTTGGGIKHSWLVDRIGLYARRPGAVAPSGWQSIIGTVERDSEVDWLPTTAAVWRADRLAVLGGFDEYFTSYSYLEDLEFSWRARRLGTLVVVADARYEHRHATAGKIRSDEFGRLEVRNRLYFVRKHGLSTPRCVIGLIVRATMTLAAAVRHGDRELWLRFTGNLHGMRAALAPFGKDLPPVPRPGPDARPSHNRHHRTRT